VSTPASAGTIDYTYDALGRVVRVVYVNGGSKTTITYSYDAAGNRTAKVVTSP
jgi:YD repeat-containing protein